MDAAYFQSLSQALDRAGAAQPVLLIDKARLDHNIDCLKQTLEQGFAFRIVAKSLPSIPLLQYVMTQTKTLRLMCFHLPFLKHIVATKWLGDIDILIGKPMPLAALKSFYYWYAEYKESSDEAFLFQPELQLQWLVDSNKRLHEYEMFARQNGLTLRVSLELDVGLHRGGFTSDQSFRKAVETIRDSEHLNFSGLMGYEAHIGKIPAFLGGAERAEKEAKQRYREFVAIAEELDPGIHNLCLNTAGSTTYSLYRKGDVCNEIASASALVKPSDFDVPTLHQHQPAAFIATPVLKKVAGPELPMVPRLSALLRTVGVLPKQGCFIYGGNWLAQPCYPKNSKRVGLYGVSSNQEMYSLSTNDQINENDFMFFRPTQSESVFLQFGKIALFDKGEIISWWPVLDANVDCLARSVESNAVDNAILSTDSSSPLDKP